MIKPEIKKDSIVAYGEGYYSVSARYRVSVNLKGVFGGPIRHKCVPISLVTEAYDEFYAHWSQSETYRCM